VEDQAQKTIDRLPLSASPAYPAIMEIPLRGRAASR
jgi:hypothetical protein